ncbi:RabGAP-TBC domain-containing protein [Cephalotus follicularis]|uniref:RabGAP-TBC domain-containing protein n=1 Tax=Cephalotus follicularis TaxID=3775 RepID=A0A1Q3DB09_CEPFO|nr:RabGAP-TBC domain-containing protein [Cephalotus follicularis]
MVYGERQKTKKKDFSFLFVSFFFFSIIHNHTQTKPKPKEREREAKANRSNCIGSKSQLDKVHSGDSISSMFISCNSFPPGEDGFWSDLMARPSSSKVAVTMTAVAGIALLFAIFFTNSRGRLKSPWSRRKKRHALSPQQWRSLFTPDGRLRDGGVKFLKKVRSRGVDPSIRPEVWPFLLGVYDLNSTKEERETIRSQKRKEYEKLRRRCRRLLKHGNWSFKPNGIGETGHNGDSCSLIQETYSSEDVVSARQSLSSEERSRDFEFSENLSGALLDVEDGSKRITNANASELYSESSDSDSSEDIEVIQAFPSSEDREENDSDLSTKEIISLSRTDVQSQLPATEDFATWQRIIRVDAVRANSEWIAYSPSQAAVSDCRAHRSAEAVGLKDYDHLEPCRIFHAARLVAILEAYALYDPEIGYCQGMSDLLSPIITVITEDHEAFWCFVGSMRKARHNFRLDEVGIRRQLNIVSKIIKRKDSHLYRHLEKLQAEDCFFVYRMVVVLFRRELTFEQTICLWEVMWADQAAIRAGIGKSAWSRIRQRAPPTDDLLLYAIAAMVLQRRKLIIEKYSSMDEILRECNSMAGQLDVWKLLDDAHNLVVTLHDKIETSL